MIREIAAYQVQYGGRLRVVGFISTGEGSYGDVRTLKLAAQRADAVANALKQARVAADRVTASATSDGAPANDARFQRVEVFLDD
ncbi:OmpA family protein [Pararhodospirillum photometricum]|uniref:OmpA family protein n=1 Tax=Pararhodospirillum photometricum TaxID=1084 RepID=UPI00031A3A7A|nr:OmpA family protein [Pararhodospirillum photometricum]